METEYYVILGVLIFVKLFLIVYCCGRCNSQTPSSPGTVLIGRPGEDTAAIVNHPAPISTSDLPPYSVRVPPCYPPSHPAQWAPAPGPGTNLPEATAPYGRPASGFQPPAGQYGFVQADSKGPPDSVV